MSKVKSTWEQVMALKKADTRHQGHANTLTEDEIITICATVAYFGGSAKQTLFDLSIPRYRLFDFIAMCVMGDRVGSPEATKVLAYSFIKQKGDIDEFIKDLRETDYDIVREWEDITL